MERLPSLRKARGLTQQDMAQALGISRQAYSNYEIGTREPDFKMLRSISAIFNVSIDYLLNNDAPTASQEKLSPESVLRRMSALEHEITTLKARFDIIMKGISATARELRTTDTDRERKQDGKA